jgi:hypothetical protein
MDACPTFSLPPTDERFQQTQSFPQQIRGPQPVLPARSGRRKPFILNFQACEIAWKRSEDGPIFNHPVSYQACFRPPIRPILTDIIALTHFESTTSNIGPPGASHWHEDC